MSVSIGNELKDSYAETINWATHNVKWLLEVQNFYTARSLLEREYSEKLRQLTTEYMQKKADNSVFLSVGEKPITTPGSLEAASVVAWNEVLSQTKLIGSDHLQFSHELQKKVVEPIGVLNKRCDILLQNIGGFASELDDRKSTAFDQVTKLKAKYDESTKDMETARVKTQSNSSSDKLKRKLAEKEHIMNNCKNDYLIQISYANRMKDKYYFQDLPEALDLLQNTIQYKTISLNKIYKNAGVLEKQLGDRVSEKLKTADLVIDKNEPGLDVSMFIKHNKKPWAEPQDFQYVPSPVWHEDGILTIKHNEDLQYMKRKLLKSELDVAEKTPIISNELQQLSSLKKKVSTINNTVDPDTLLGDMKSYIKVISSFTNHETRKLNSSVVMESIKNNLSNYDLNTDNIDTTEKKSGGFFSKLIGKKSTHQSSGVLASGSVNRNQDHAADGDAESYYSQASGDTNDAATNRTRSSTVFSAKSTIPATNDSDDCKVMYPYVKADADEISVQPGESVSLVEPDNNGWTKIQKANGEVGLVPSTYVQVTGNGKKTTASAPPPPRSRNTATKTTTMTAAYDYEAQGSDEMSISVGDVIKVVQKDSGNGWTLGDLNGVVGLFPTAYCS